MTTIPVKGARQANDYGLYDMMGNVSEWVWDRYGFYPLTGPEAPDVDPDGPAEGTTRVHRGGSWRGALRGPPVHPRGVALVRRGPRHVLGPRAVREPGNGTAWAAPTLRLRGGVRRQRLGLSPQ